MDLDELTDLSKYPWLFFFTQHLDSCSSGDSEDIYMISHGGVAIFNGINWSSEVRFVRQLFASWYTENLIVGSHKTTMLP